MTLRALELFCGIGGFSAAVAGWNVQVVGALDQSEAALSVYRLNFPAHAARRVDLERIGADDLAAFGADLWWLSPPCQPYCLRGSRRDLDDPRARSLSRLLGVLDGIPDHHLPGYLALENVAGFSVSQARERLLAILAVRGYQCRERHLCPTELGVPSRRPRYYLLASRTGLREPPHQPSLSRPLADYLRHDPQSMTELVLPAAVLDRFGPGLRLLDSTDPAAYTTCFTSSYGKSLQHAGSYLRHGEEARRFTPEEIACLLHFPDGFCFPEEMSIRKSWQLVGNSLSVIAVREVLRILPGLKAAAA